MPRRIILLTEGVADPAAAKTAVNLLRYRPDEVAAVFDRARAGRSAGEVFGVGGDTPVIASLDECGDGDTLMVGVAPAGGMLPAAMREVILAGIGRGMTIVSGLHQFLSEDTELREAAQRHGARLHDIRKNNERQVAQRRDIRNECLRIHTVGHDCNVGKMVVSVELTRALRERGFDAKFVATGQTGIMIEGDGCPVDAVIADFINGAAERLVLANQHHEILLIEGQGSIAHPRYSAVTLGLLHGCLPDGLILCYEVGRENVMGMESIRIPPLRKLRDLYESMSSIMHPCRVIGIAMNTRKSTAEAARAERVRIEADLNLPACDVVRDGPGPLVDAINRLQTELGKR